MGNAFFSLLVVDDYSFIRPSVVTGPFHSIHQIPSPKNILQPIKMFFFFFSPIVLPFFLFCLYSLRPTHSLKVFGNESEKTDNETLFVGNYLTQSEQTANDTFDPMVDDFFALIANEKEHNNGTTQTTNDGIEMGEDEAEEGLIDQCAAQLSPFVSLLLMPPHYLTWDFGCHFRGNLSQMNSDYFKSENDPNGHVEVFWQMSKPCRSSKSFRSAVVAQPNCHLFIGFVDHLYQFFTSTLITKFSDKTMEGKEAVVRLVCGKEMEWFTESKEKEEGKKKNGDEETFLKSLIVVEKTWLADCLAVFFDSRALDLQLDSMAKLLWKDGPPKLGTADGNYKWAASKFLCGEEQRNVFFDELNKMKTRNEKMVKGALVFENGQNEVRNVLLKKSDEELYCSEQKVEKGFLQRFWDELFG